MDRAQNHFIDAISAHLTPDETSQIRAASIIETMKQISQAGEQP